MTEKKTYHITVTEKESGKIILDTDSVAAIIVSNDSEGTTELKFASCGTLSLTNVVLHAEDAVRELYKQHPEVNAAAELIRAIESLEHDNEGAEKADNAEGETE